jgi:hypothetical protein
MTSKKEISELVLETVEKDPLVEVGDRFFQVDFLKAAMIFLVIFDHIVSWSIKSYIAVTFWERISIPVFLVIMGFNMGRSLQRSEAETLRQLYSWSYFKRKILRYIVPFLVLYAASTFIGLFMYNFDFIAMYDNQYYPNHGIMNLFIGILPFWGPGNWFIPVILQSILIIPLLYRGFKKKPVLTLILCFIVEIVMQLLVFFFIGDLYPGGVISWPRVHILNMFMTSVFFYLPAIGLGLWFSFGYKLNDNRNFFMWIIYPISLAFMTVHQFFAFRIRVDGLPLLRGDYHLLIVPYSAFLFLLAMKFLPKNPHGRLSRGISLISKSTYHILLTQILGYGMVFAFWGDHYAVNTLITFPLSLNDASVIFDSVVNLVAVWILFISFGILWYKIDQNKNTLRRVLYYLNFFIVLSSVMLFTFWLQAFWIPIPLIIILAYAIGALITRYAIKRPFNTKILGLWTLVLVTTFTMMILQVVFFQTHEYWITMFSIGASLTIAITGTILDSIQNR